MISLGPHTTMLYSPHRRLRSTATLVGFGLLGLLTSRADVPGQPAATSTLTSASLSPAVTSVSLTVREGYDTNIFGTTSAVLPGHPDLADLESWVTVINPSFTLNLLPWITTPDSNAFLKRLTFLYSGEGTLYAEDHSEDNLKNTFDVQLKGERGPWTLFFDNPLVYVAGTKNDPFYATYSPLGYRAARDRRKQIQERNTSFLRYDASQWFVRADASALYYNLLINEHNPTGVYKGYLNFVNRDDINTGLDFGYNITKDFAFVAGWRVGQQTQARLYYSAVDNDSTYNRALFGFEGKPWSWLKVQVTAGPDWRRYSDGSNVGIAHNRDTWLYMDNSVTATLSSADTLSFTNKVWHWVSATGSTSYQETTENWTYRHALTKAFSASLGFIVQGVRYDAPSVRNDWTTSYVPGLSYAFSPWASVSIDYLNTRGRTAYSPIVTPGQDWNEQQTFLSIKLSR